MSKQGKVSIKANSKKEFVTENPTSIANIQLGAILRMADSIERMEKPFLDLHKQINFYKSRCERLEIDNKILKNSNRGLKASLTRFKKAHANT